MNQEFVARLNTTFGNATVAEVARRLQLPHATVRNYYLGRLPAPEVLMNISEQTNVSLTWLLSGKGAMYVGDLQRTDIAAVLEMMIENVVERKLNERLGAAVKGESFDLAASVREHDDPQKVLSDGYVSDGLKPPRGYGVVFFKGWESMSQDDKAEAVRDARRVLDRSRKSSE